LEGIVPRAAWHWGRDSSVINDPLEEPGRTPLCVGLPSASGSMEGDFMFFPTLYEGFFFGGLWQTYMYRHSSGSGDGVFSPHRDPAEEHGGDFLTRDSEGKMNFQGMRCRRFCRGVCLLGGVPLGTLGMGSIYRELREIVEGGLWKRSISLYRSSVRENLEAYKKALEMGTSFHGDLPGKSGRWLICQGLMCGRRF